MTFVFYALMYVPAILSGLGYIAKSWLIVSLIAAWIWSIWLNSSKGAVDYGNLDAKSFVAKDRKVLTGTLIRVITIAAVYGLASIFSA